MHLGSANDQVLAEAVAFTGTFTADRFTFHGGHCTGGRAIAYFRETFGDDAVKPLGAGRVIRYSPMLNGDPGPGEATPPASP